VPGDGRDPSADGSFALAFYASEVARLRREADYWRRVAEKQRVTLDAVEPIVKLLRATAVVDARGGAEGRARATALPVPADRVAVPAHVRDAAMFELAVLEARMRAKRSSTHPRSFLKRPFERARSKRDRRMPSVA
jgi:hypothetical protein